MAAGAEERSRRPVLRPQTIVLTFLGHYVLDTGEAVSAGSLIEMLNRVGVGTYAARSTINRMTERGRLERRRRGKRVYLRTTPREYDIVADARNRSWSAAINRTWDGTWTLLAFSMPEARRAERHSLRTRLQWAGFGLLQNGLWIAAGRVDVAELLNGLDVLDDVTAFYSSTSALTEIEALIGRCWDLAELRLAYESFLNRWDQRDPLPEAADDLARQQLLFHDWFAIVREDPRLPLQHLPPDWPAVRAEQVALELRARYDEPAREIAEGFIDRIAVDKPAATG